MPDLTLMFLLVSCLSLSFQVLALVRLARQTRQRAGGGAEKLVGAGYIRTIACRILAATIYVAVASVQLAGDGTLSAEALIVFASVQLIWWLNSVMDIRIRRTLSEPGTGGRHGRR
jgi:hypothetical protein